MFKCLLLNLPATLATLPCPTRVGAPHLLGSPDLSEQGKRSTAFSHNPSPSFSRHSKCCRFPVSVQPNSHTCNLGKPPSLMSSDILPCHSRNLLSQLAPQGISRCKCQCPYSLPVLWNEATGFSFPSQSSILWSREASCLLTQQSLLG